jgi:hypothetical protein
MSPALNRTESPDVRRQRLSTLAQRLLDADGSDALAGLSTFLKELAEVAPELIQQINASIELRRLGVRASSADASPL